MTRFARNLVPLAIVVVAGCGFSNALYNARIRLGDADRAAARGDTAAAGAAYRDAIERAAKRYRDGVATEDAAEALYLVARGRSGLREHDAAVAALRRVLALSRDRARRARAHAMLGGELGALGDDDLALAHLDTALLTLDDRALAGRARLWRGNLRLRNGDAAGWSDLDAAIDAGGGTAVDARAVVLEHALAADDSARARTAFAGLLDDERAAAHAGTVIAAASAAADRWGAAAALEMLAPAPDARWPAAARDPVLLTTARVAARTDLASGIDRAVALAEVATPAVEAEARLDAARWSLHALDDERLLDRTRDLLLPAAGSSEADSLLSTLDLIGSMLNRGRNRGQPLALFAAAEVARDQLAAPALACRLFREYAATQPEAVWAPKALLAAAVIRPVPGDSLERMFADYPDNPYVVAWRGGKGADVAYDDAERRLARDLAALRGEIAADSGAGVAAQPDTGLTAPPQRPRPRADTLLRPVS